MRSVRERRKEEERSEIKAGPSLSFDDKRRRERETEVSTLFRTSPQKKKFSRLTKNWGIEEREHASFLSAMAAASAAAAAATPVHQPYMLERAYKFGVDGDMTALLLFR